MSHSVTQYDLLVSCPGDVKEELECIEKAVDEFNGTFSDTLSISIRVKHWSKNSYPQSGDKPQKLLNEQFVKDCDAAVAIMWTRFGTPTDEYGSGTEEEIEIMLEAGRQVFMYFCDKPLPPSQMNSAEYKRVQTFKENYKVRGIYDTYTSTEDFQKKFYAHLTKYFLGAKTIEEMKEVRQSFLSIKGIDENESISDNAHIYQFTLNNDFDIESSKDKIKSLFSQIEKINIEKIVNPFFSPNNFLKVVNIEDNVKSYISAVAKQIGITLSNDFFDLGELRQSVIASTMRKPDFKGTDDEIKKYYLIMELHSEIIKSVNMVSLSEKFNGLKFIELVLSNTGTDIDEDVEVSLLIPKSAFVNSDWFSDLSNSNKAYLMNDTHFYDLLQIGNSVEFYCYHEAVPKTKSIIPSDSLLGKYSADQFRDYLEDALEINVFPKDNMYILKVKFDYIKHHTAVAFPSIILLNDYITEIPYTITSKHCANEVNGIITVVLH